MSTRIALVDPHAPYRQRLAELLAGQGARAIVFQVADVQAAMRLIASGARADVVLVDIDLPAGSGLRALRRLARQQPAARLVALSLYDDPALASAALCAGATGFASKSGPLEDLVAALR